MSSSSSIVLARSAEGPSVRAPALALVFSFIFFGVPGLGGGRLDVMVQDAFFFDDHWLIEWDSGPLHVLFYKGPKLLLVAWSAFLLWCALMPQSSPAWMGPRRALYLGLCLVAIVMVCTQLRAVTGQTVPQAMRPWKPDGLEHLLLFQSKPPGYPSDAFPAGHASGGFALLALAWAWPVRRLRLLGLSVGLGLGGFMGVYQMARGEHFLSHTLATGLIAWLICALTARFFAADLSSPPSS
jgi:membrane-associated PAP2 superfamily phosphatase